MKIKVFLQTFDIISDLSLGSDPDSLEKGSELQKCLHGMLSTAFNRAFNVFRLSTAFNKAFQMEFIDTVFNVLRG